MEWEFELAAGPYGGPSDGLWWDGEGLLFSVQSTASVLRYLPEQGSAVEYCKHLPGVRGLAMDASGVLFACQSPARRLIRFHADGRIGTMPHTLEDGRYHNYPDDLVIDSQRRIWFSDPHADSAPRGAPPQGSLDFASVLRLEQHRDRSWAIQRMTFDTSAPRGVLLSADEQTLYVADDGDEGGDAQLRAYPVRGDGTLGLCDVLLTFGRDHRGIHRGIDGMCLDSAGNIVACAGGTTSGPGPAIYVIAPTGRVLETHEVPADEPRNCAFGDQDLESLYVTSGEGHLFRVRNSGLRGATPTST